MTIKLTVDNAAYSLPIVGIDGAQVSLNTQGVDPSQLPEQGDWVEIESLVRLPWVSGQPAPLLEADKLEDDRVILKTAPPNLPQSQLTRWQFVAENVNVTSTVEEFKGLLEVHFDIDKVEHLKPGDWWEILIRTAQPGEEFSVRGYRQSPYYAPLADITVNNAGVITDLVDLRQPLHVFGTGRDMAACPETPAQTATPPIQPVTPMGAFAPTIAPAILNELGCRRIFTSLQTTAANRWLASAKFGEIAALSRADLRARIERDCPPDQYDDKSLDLDVNNIVATRQKFLAGRSMIA